jgi:hypothetical protein
MRLINRHPDRSGRLLLILLPFALLLFAYFAGPAQRLADNPNDKLLDPDPARGAAAPVDSPWPLSPTPAGAWCSSAIPYSRT